MLIKRFFVFSLLYTILLFSIFLFFNTPVEVDLNFHRICFVLYFIASLLFFWMLKGKNNNPLSFNYIFLLGYFIVFFQVVLLQYLGYSLLSWAFDKYWSSSNIENLALIISLVAIVLYMLGNLHGRLHLNKIKFKKETGSVFFLLALAYVSYFLFFITSGSYRSGVYYAGDALSVSKYFFKLFNAFLLAAMIVKLTTMINHFKVMRFKEYISFFGLPLLLLLGWHLCFSLYVGDRGVIISYGLLFISVYFFKYKRISILQVTVILICASISLTIIGKVRQSHDKSLTYLDQIEASFFQENTKKSRWFEQLVPGDSFVELALSGRTLNNSLAFVPKVYEYGYGRYALKRVAGIIPGAQGVLSKLIDREGGEYNSTSSFITFLIQGKQATSSDGTSITADLYLDFGVIGVFGGMFFFGYFIGKNEKKMYAEHVSYLNLTWVAFIIFYSKSLYLSRGSIFLELSGIFLVWFFLHMNNIAFNAFKKSDEL